MSVTVSKRKKYVRPMTATWWKKLDFYKAYMVREATSIFAVWFCIVLLYGVLCLASNPEPGLGIVDFIGFLRNPIVVFLNIITLIATLYHTATYFVMTPKVMNIIVKNERLPHHVLRNALWAVTAVISVIALILVYM
ncbi:MULTISPECIES: fumarate reductase subunit FrdC [Haemophilus]|uniref:Fumarate reductase subunit C n=1 Tax=Haemophilus parainfluenzae TaxID=729 RepID=A0AB37IKN1_HAEPA|nr:MULTISPECIES: fumarate reductase subunit FrdC [Haemophilus]OFQ19807.1 fumarate reductase subunit C [Haemophilus sp. HMSC073C03]RDE94260.1 fumarate reductase subunit FrdC [Haemophilus parainfluenzae]RDF07886.1 fumarate reductase subunit FrdC [Haemophilus parainfluenzae]